MNLSNLIKNQRKQLSLSQMDLARLADLSLPMIQNLESGKANPSLSTLLAIFKVLGWKFEVKSDPNVIQTFLDLLEGRHPGSEEVARRYAVLALQHLTLSKVGEEYVSEVEGRAKLALFVISEQVVSLSFSKDKIYSVLEKSDSVLGFERKFWLSSGGLRKTRSLVAKVF